MMKRGGRGRDRGGTFASVVEEQFMIFHRFVCQVRCHFFSLFPISPRRFPCAHPSSNTQPFVTISRTAHAGLLYL